MFKIEHILASNYAVTPPVSPNPTTPHQQQLKQTKLKITSLQLDISNLTRTISQLQTQLTILKNKNLILLGELQSKPLTPEKSVDLMQSNFSLPTPLKTPTFSSLNKELRFDTEQSKNKLRSIQKYSIFKVDHSLFDSSEKFSQFPKSAGKSHQPYRRFKSLVKLFASTLVEIGRNITGNVNYRNQELLEEFKRDICEFVGEFNLKHQEKKVVGMEEKEQKRIIERLTGLARQGKVLLDITFGGNGMGNAVSSKNCNGR